MQHSSASCLTTQKWEAQNLHLPSLESHKIMPAHTLIQCIAYPLRKAAE